MANHNPATPLQRLAAQQNWETLRLRGAIANLKNIYSNVDPYIAQAIGTALVELRIAERELPKYHERKREDLRDIIREQSND